MYCRCHYCQYIEKQYYSSLNESFHGKGVGTESGEMMEKEYERRREHISSRLVTLVLVKQPVISKLIPSLLLRTEYSAAGTSQFVSFRNSI